MFLRTANMNFSARKRSVVDEHAKRSGQKRIAPLRQIMLTLHSQPRLTMGLTGFDSVMKRYVSM
ncbi:hypothetical protein HR10_09905 [Porphyromonas gulae]|nr:hypothetical protein HR10_09905 [Porphyromonas gulae]